MNQPDIALLKLLIEDEASRSCDAVPRWRGETAPLSFAQQRLWLLQCLEPSSTAYNLPRAFRLEGLLNAHALELAFRALIARHAVLRTVFEQQLGEPRQRVLAEVPFHLVVEEMTEILPDDRHATLAQRLREEAARPFDLSRPPLLRATLVRFSEQDHGLLLSLHHLVSDAWSNPILAHDLAAAYAQVLAGGQGVLTPLPLQYADYAAWQRHHLQGDALETSVHYWRARLGERMPALELPTDMPRPPRQSHRGRRLRFALPEALVERAQRFCRAEAITPFVLLLATWQVLLGRYSGQQVFALGVPHAVRHRQELEELLGFFVNTLVYRVDLPQQLTGRALCRRLRQESLAALEHAELPFEMLLDQLQVERDPSRSPLFQAMFNLSSGAPVRLRLADIECAPLLIEEDSAKFDLSLDVAVRPDGVQCELEYNVELFLPATAERLAEHYRQLLAALLEEPEQSVWQLPILSEGERCRQLDEWNDSARALASHLDMVALFEEQVRQRPASCALICGGERLSYAELNARANRLAHWLRGAGIGPECVVAVCLERESALLVTLLAILKAGGAYLPIDPAQPEARNADILAQARPRLLVTRETLVGRFALGLPSVTLETLAGCLAGMQEDNLALPVQPRQLAYSLYTSGSTGRPKGVQIERQSFANFLHGVQEQVGLLASDRLLAVTTLGFDIAGLELFLPLLQGGCVVLAQRDQQLQPSALLALLETHSIGVMQATPATWQMLVEHDSPAWSGLRALCGGEALGAELAERLLVRGVRLLNLYGPTETTVWSSAHPVAQVDAATIPIGRPLANNRLHVLDEYLAPQPPGVAGDLYIGGAGLARGYADRPELTAGAFIPNPFARAGAPGSAVGSRLYRTGDRARYRADGSIEFLGRNDFQVKLRGFRIELGEIEAVLCSQVDVQQAVVVVRRSPAGQDALVAYLRGAPTVDQASLLAAMKARLPGYMIPSLYVRLEQFPLNANGKVDRQALPEPSWGKGTEITPPRSDSEMALAAIWEEVLGLRELSVQDNLFALGAQSIQLVRIQARITRSFGCEVPLAELFAHPSLADMALLIEQSVAAGGAHADELALIDSLLGSFE